MSKRDATLLSVMYGAGLRSGEALALRDESIRDRTLLVESSISFGMEKDTQTRKARAVRLLAPIAQDSPPTGLPRRRSGSGAAPCSAS